MIRIILLNLLFLLPLISYGKKAESGKGEGSPLTTIQNDIAALCSERMGGRQTGTEGEKLAAEYIANRFKTLNIAPYKNKYTWDFTFKAGIRLGNNAYFKVFDAKLVPGLDVIFLPYGKASPISGSALPKVYEPENVWLIPISTLAVKQTNNVQKVLYEHAAQCISKDAGSIVFLNDLDPTYDLASINLNTFEGIKIPVAFINHKAYLNNVKPNLKKDWIEIDSKVGYENASTTGTNVIAMIDNNAPFNILITCNYDHLGNNGVLYKGADNNASGVAAMLYIAEMVKNYNLKRFNYIFVAFSGKEADKQGSRSFIMQNEFILNNISCVIQLDKVGRLNTLKDLYAGGVGTSPGWATVLQKMNKGFTLHIDSSGVGYSDLNTFYYKNIPVLNVSTGFTDDYMRVNDDESRINYNGIAEVCAFTYRMIAELDKQTKMIFNQTHDMLPVLNKLKTDIGIIHDFSYDQNGIRVATTLPGSKAAMAGMLNGDIITKIGMFGIIDYDDFMEAITKSPTGKEVTIMVKRGKNDFKFFVVL